MLLLTILCFFYKALSDNDSLLGYINSVHDSHMLAIDNKVQYTAHIGLLVDIVNSRHNCNSLLIFDCMIFIAIGLLLS